jgi:hypothetical protein
MSRGNHTSGVDNEVVGLSTDADGGDIAHILVGDGTRAGILVANSLLAIGLGKTGKALLLDVLNVGNVGNILDGDGDDLITSLEVDGSGRDGGGSGRYNDGASETHFGLGNGRLLEDTEEMSAAV